MELIRCILRQGTVFFKEGGWGEEERGAEKSEAYLGYYYVTPKPTEASLVQTPSRSLTNYDHRHLLLTLNWIRSNCDAFDGIAWNNA